MIFFHDPRGRWRVRSIDGVEVRDLGDTQPVDAIARAFAKGGVSAAKAILVDSIGHFAAVLSGPQGTLAFVDHCRSIPLFYDEAGTAVATDPRALMPKRLPQQVDETSALEAAMAGYVTGHFTLYRGLFQIPSGEFLFAPSGNIPLRREQYFLYRPIKLRTEPIDVLASELAGIVDRIVRRAIEAADGVPVWVPLSAGLDSRILLCKFAELGCPNLQSFSYGPRGNDEAQAAREVAKRLGVPWRFVASTRASTKAFFASDVRRRYWDFSDGLCSVPNPQDIVALTELMETGVVRKGDFIVNGQTGDFISGNHIPKQFVDGDTDADGLFDAIEAKHFSLWKSLKTKKNLDLVRARLFDQLGLSGTEKLSGQQAAELYECWEYRERQAKYIVNGERIYDFLGLRWRLPLWDQEFVKFWRDIPAKTKIGQAVYRAYLKAYDYKGLFRDFHPKVWHWPGLMMAVLPAARVIRLTAGVESRDRFLKSLLYFGMYRHHYSVYRYRDFLRHVADLRSPVSLLVATWLREEGIELEGLPSL